MRPVRAGSLRHRATIQYPTRAGGGYNGSTVTWTTLATVWAAVEPLSGREYIAAQQEQVEVSTRIRIRYRRDVTAFMRVVIEGHTYEVITPLDFEARHRELQLMCREVI